MPGSEFRTKAAECERLARDTTRTEAQRAESQLQKSLWLKMANEADENDNARPLRIALRATKQAASVGVLFVIRTVRDDAGEGDGWRHGLYQSPGAQANGIPVPQRGVRRKADS